MAIGLKLRDVRRFGQKIQKGVRNIARKVEKGADIASSILTPFAGAIAGPEGIAAVKGLTQGIKGAARGVERVTGKGVGKGTKLFQSIQQPVLGAQELVKGIKTAVRNPAEGEIMMGNTLASRFPQRKMRGGIQRSDGSVVMPVNDWNELPFAEGM